MKLVPALFRSANVLEIAAPAREWLKRQQATIFCGNSYVAELRPLCLGGGLISMVGIGLSPPSRPCPRPRNQQTQRGSCLRSQRTRDICTIKFCDEMERVEQNDVSTGYHDKTLCNRYTACKRISSQSTTGKKRDLGPSIKLLTFTNCQYSGAEKPKLESAHRV